MIVAVFSGLNFVATTSSDEKCQEASSSSMIERIKHILIIRDIYLGLLTMPKNGSAHTPKRRRALKKRLTKP